MIAMSLHPAGLKLMNTHMFMHIIKAGYSPPGTSYRKERKREERAREMILQSFPPR